MKTIMHTLTALGLFVSIAQTQTDPLTDAQKKVEAATRKLSDARATTAQLVSALQAAQVEVLRANREVEAAYAAMVQSQNAARAAQIDAEAKAIDTIRDLIGPAALKSPVLVPKTKEPPRKSIFDTKAKPPAPPTPVAVIPPPPPSAVSELAAALGLAANGTPPKTSKAPPTPMEIEKPKSRTGKLMWIGGGGDGFEYLWHSNTALVGWPLSSKTIDKMQFYVDDKWVPFRELRSEPGSSGWVRHFAGDVIVLSTKGRDAQLMVDGKWHWIPESK